MNFEWIFLLEVTGIFCALIFAVASLLCTYMYLKICPHSAKQKAFADLLPYACFENDGAIVLKNGSRLSIFEMSGLEEDSLLQSQIDHARALLRRFLMHSGGQWTMHFELLRFKEDIASLEPYYGNTPSSFLNTEHARAFSKTEIFENHLYLCLCYRSDLKTGIKQEHGAFIKERNALCALLDSVLPLKLLQEGNKDFDEALSFLKTSLCMRKKKVAVAAPDSALDTLLGSYEFIGGNLPQLDGHPFALVTIDTYPSQATSGMLNVLSKLPFEYRFSTRFICFDSLKTSFKLRRRRRMYEQRRRGFFNQIFNIQSTHCDQDAVKQIDDIEDALGKVSSRDENFGAISQVVIIADDNLSSLQKKCHQCISAIEEAGFTARIETVNAIEAFLGSLPGESVCNVRRPLMNVSAIAYLLPLFVTYHGEKVSPCKNYDPKLPLLSTLSSDDGLFNLNLHSQDLGNTLVSGPPGSGKSVLLNALIHALLRYKHMKIWAFERGYSLYSLCRYVQGEHVLLDGSVSLCPLQDLNTPEDFACAQSFIRTLCNGGKKMNAEVEKILHTTLHLLSQSKGHDHSLSHLYLLCSNCHELAWALKPHLRTNGLGILDGEQDPGFNSTLNVFECAGLLDRPDESAPVLTHLLSKIRRECESNSHPKAIILDEAWLMLKDEIFLRELLAWLKTLRKHNTLVIIATQSLLDVVNTGGFENFLDCIKTRIYLPNPDACQNTLKRHYEECGLNEQQIKAVASGISKKEFFLQKDGHFSRLRLLLSEEELKVFTKAGKYALDTSLMQS